jgi:class 3 adenylate cyclase
MGRVPDSRSVEQNMVKAQEGPLTAGREAAARYAWRAAFDRLIEADAGEPLAADDLDALAEAAWWVARLDVAIAARERAFAGYLEDKDERRAGMMAIWLAKDNYSKRASAVAGAWMKRADRLLADKPTSIEYGYLERMKAVLAFEGLHEYADALVRADRALEIGTEQGDRDLMAVALHDRGRILVATGAVDDGFAAMDEATVAAVSGELSPYWTAAIYCNTISACRDVADYARANEWSEAAKRWCERQTISGFPGLCRVYRAEIMRLRGAWAEAEQEARLATEELRDFNVSYAAAAFYEVGEIRLRAGDLVGASDAFREAHELGHTAQPGLALLRLAEGDVESAATSMSTALRGETADRLRRARLLPAEVEIALAVGDSERAEAATVELEKIAEDFGSTAMRAGAEAARGALSLSEGDSEGAVHALRNACRLWQELDAPYEAGETRMWLGLAYRARGDDADARLELEAARMTFDRLGAVREAQRASDILAAGRRQTGVSASRTFMFTDIVKSTSLLEAIGDEAWTHLLRWHDETIRSLLREHHGEEIDHAGDGFFVAFDSARAALDCATAIQRTLREHRQTHGFSPEVRIGLHEAEARRVAGTFRGKGVHEAARIGALARGGEIVASLATLEEAGALDRISEHREVTLKGIARPVEVANLRWD